MHIFICHHKFFYLCSACPKLRLDPPAILTGGEALRKKGTRAGQTGDGRSKTKQRAFPGKLMNPFGEFGIIPSASDGKKVDGQNWSIIKKIIVEIQNINE